MSKISSSPASLGHLFQEDAAITIMRWSSLMWGLTVEGIGYQQKGGKGEWRNRYKEQGDSYSEWKIWYWKESDMGWIIAFTPALLLQSDSNEQPTHRLRSGVQERQEDWPRLELVIQGLIWAPPRVEERGRAGRSCVHFREVLKPRFNSPESQGSVQTGPNFFGLKQEQSA